MPVMAAADLMSPTDEKMYGCLSAFVLFQHCRMVLHARAVELCCVNQVQS